MIPFSPTDWRILSLSAEPGLHYRLMFPGPSPASRAPGGSEAARERGAALALDPSSEVAPDSRAAPIRRWPAGGPKGPYVDFGGKSRCQEMLMDDMSKI